VTAGDRDQSPVISVVVPTIGRPRYLENCLAALAASELAPERFEVVAVDD
jgi:glycosyltransferase involved in cell wall biosynthesis